MGCLNLLPSHKYRYGPLSICFGYSHSKHLQIYLYVQLSSSYIMLFTSRQSNEESSFSPTEITGMLTLCEFPQIYTQLLNYQLIFNSQSL